PADRDSHAGEMGCVKASPIISYDPKIMLDRTNEREEMVTRQIAARGVRDERVLDALRRIPRERFLPDETLSAAYDDRALSVGLGQTISQPYIVAYMTEMLEVDHRHRVLEIGTGTGYQTVILAMLAAQVYTVERFEELSLAAQRRVADLGLKNVLFRVGDGSLGWPEAAPYDRIMVTAAAERMPGALVDQIGEGGVMIIPVGEDSAQTLVRVERSGGKIAERPLLGVRFVPLVSEGAMPRAAQ
ncbi:MAG TPA: protein-L-isoaspartate(D-aspartate) O-methyltransferase, partial [Phycisphaerae bacterium]|nr:protein-L-isoaspartate(D-aspartate) O-methyltransferase [Phycisphaerae bacterium]